MKSEEEEQIEVAEGEETEEGETGELEVVPNTLKPPICCPSHTNKRVITMVLNLLNKNSFNTDKFRVPVLKVQKHEEILVRYLAKSMKITP